MKSAVIKLTPSQKEALSDLFSAVKEASERSENADYSPDVRMSILGQVWSDTDNTVQTAGCAKFWLLSKSQYDIVNRAIKRAAKLQK